VYREGEEAEALKNELVKRLDITKNPQLYSLPEVFNYHDYNSYLQKDSDPRKDHFLHLRTDDIEGAMAKKWWLNPRRGKKTKDFFPEVPDINDYYNKFNKGLQTTKRTTVPP